MGYTLLSENCCFGKTEEEIKASATCMSSQDAVFILFKKIYLFLIWGWLLYSTVLVSTIHQHESATGIHKSPPSCTSTHLPSHLTPLGCHRALNLSSILFVCFSLLLFCISNTCSDDSNKRLGPHLENTCGVIIQTKCRVKGFFPYCSWFEVLTVKVPCIQYTLKHQEVVISNRYKGSCHMAHVSDHRYFF